MRSSRSLGSNAVKVTKLPFAAVATLAQVLPANPARTAFAVLNKTDAAVNVYLSDLAGITQGETVTLAVGQYWEDPANWQGAITVQGGTTGTVNVTEWL